MMKLLESRVLWGSLLVLAGILFLLQNLGIVPLGNLFWAILLGLAGVFFLTIFVQNRLNWWSLIPGFALLGIAASVAASQFAPDRAGVWSEMFVLGSIGLSFLVIYFVDRRNWWAIIPAGVLITLAAVSVLSTRLHDATTGGVFFLGLGATFGLVALLPNPQAELRWAWIPAGILALMGLLLMASAERMIAALWPVALILGGGFLIFRTMRKR